MRSRLVGLAAGVLAVASCNFSTSGDGGTDGGGNCTPASTRVCMIGTTSFSFSPANLTVTAGATVTWQNLSPAIHTVTAAMNSKEIFNSGDIAAGGTYARVFNNAGTFPYYCVYHGENGSPPIGMSGTITVRAMP